MSAGRMYWADLETTGLDMVSDVIIQVGLAITDADLNLVVQRQWYLWSPSIERKYNQLAFLDEEFPKDDRAWAFHQHHSTGLWDECRERGIMPGEASAQITEWLDDEFLAPSDPMCGSSVHFDRAFLKAHMPRVEKMFGYRNIDISTLKELAKRWNPKIVPTSSQHQPAHLAQNDLLNTLDEARVYRDAFLKDEYGFSLGLIAFLVYQTGGSLVLTDQEHHDIEAGKYRLTVQDNAVRGIMTFYADKEE